MLSVLSAVGRHGGPEVVLVVSRVGVHSVSDVFACVVVDIAAAGLQERGSTVLFSGSVYCHFVVF